MIARGSDERVARDDSYFPILSEENKSFFVLQASIREDHVRVFGPAGALQANLHRIGWFLDKAVKPAEEEGGESSE